MPTPRCKPEARHRHPPWRTTRVLAPHHRVVFPPIRNRKRKRCRTSPGINTKALHDQLSRECDLLMNPPTQNHPMVGVHSQYTWTVSFSIKPSTQPNCASPPPSEPASPLSTNRHLLLLVLAHHLLEETSRINNKAFRNIGFHTMQVVSRRSGVNRIIPPSTSNGVRAHSTVVSNGAAAPSPSSALPPPQAHAQQAPAAAAASARAAPDAGIFDRVPSIPRPGGSPHPQRNVLIPRGPPRDR